MTETNGGILIHLPHGQGEQALARLDRYLIADDAELEMLAPAALTHLVTGDFRVPEGILTGQPPHFPAFDGPANSPSAPDFPVAGSRAVRLRDPGLDLWPDAEDFPRSSMEALAKIPVLAPADLERWRVCSGIPREGREIVPGMLVPEAGISKSDLSYQKGCYIGQEVISRIKSAGKLNRILSLVELSTALLPAPGDVLTNESGEPVAEITSAEWLIPEQTACVLAFVKRTKQDAPLHWTAPADA